MKPRDKYLMLVIRFRRLKQLVGIWMWSGFRTIEVFTLPFQILNVLASLRLFLAPLISLSPRLGFQRFSGFKIITTHEQIPGITVQLCQA